jgi:hypothetical protein
MRHIEYLIIVIVSLIVFGNSVFNDYNLDDQLVLDIKSNDVVDIFTTSYHQENGINYGYMPIFTLNIMFSERVLI